MSNGFKRVMTITPRATCVRLNSHLLTLTSTLMLVLSGCRHTPPEMIRGQLSPDGRMRAELSVDTNTRTNGSDIYRVSLAGTQSGSHKVIILEANHGSEISLQWNKPNELVIVCSQCPIESVDVHYYRLSADGVSVSFSGIPLEPAKLRQ